MRKSLTLILVSVAALLAGCKENYEATIVVATGMSRSEMARHPSMIDGFGSNWDIATYHKILIHPKIWEERVAPRLAGKVNNLQELRSSIALSASSAKDDGNVRVTEIHLKMSGSKGDDFDLVVNLLAENIEYFSRKYWGTDYSPYVRDIKTPNFEQRSNAQ